MSEIKPSIMMVVRSQERKLSFDEFEKRYKERLSLFRDVPGLVQKYFSYDQSTMEWAGIYLWDSQENLDAYLESDLRKSIPSAYGLTEPPKIEFYPIVGMLRD